MIKKIGIVVLFFFITKALFVITINSAEVIYNPQTAENFTVSIGVAEVVNFRGVSIEIQYNQALLSFQNAVRGTLFLGQNVGWWVVNTSQPGIIRVECVIFGAGQFTSGPGNILNLNFQAILNGTGTFHFLEATIYAVDGSPIPNVHSNDFYLIVGEEAKFAKAKCFLEGPFSAGIMNTNLHAHIPLNSPYAQNPVSVDFIPFDAVDWVLVEIRESIEGPAISYHSKFLYDDGAIRSIHLPCMSFQNLSGNEYFLAIHHRNHLSIMSNSIVAITTSFPTEEYDFSNSANVIGSNGIKELESGIFGMVSGDANGNGVINSYDKTGCWIVNAGKHGYYASDFNLDGNVFPNDLNQYWRINHGRFSDVPQILIYNFNIFDE
jgi:hypothetical protein